jgi:hypothetical protein
MTASSVEMSPERGAVTLLPQVTCPHCWERFPPEQMLWISEHVDLLGDPMLGGDHQRRFLPSRFTIGGDSVDAKGMVCTRLACPRCHLPVPRTLLELEPLFASILGTPSSGKSYFLASMTWQLRTMLATHFATAFTDVDTSSNRSLNLYEESLFLNEKSEEIVPLGDLIEKTQLQGELYNTVSYGRQSVSYPRPFLFGLRPQAHHPSAAKVGQLSRVLCVYDNAGEHFRPDQDTTASPVTRHLARSQLLFFVFDPTQDPRVRGLCRRGDRAGNAGVGKLSRQETVLNEAAARVRRFAGLSSSAKLDRPLIVVLSKSDEWGHLLNGTGAAEPWARLSEDLYAVHTDAILQHSQAIRRLMLRHCPEIVSAAEDFASEVTYIAVSALGDDVELDPKTNLMGIRPSRIRPRWATVPMIYGLSRVLPGLVQRTRRTSS